MTPQCNRILRYMEENGSITPLDALNYTGCFRLASRISDLRKEGYEIDREMVTVQNKYGEKCTVASYSLAGRT